MTRSAGRIRRAFADACFVALMLAIWGVHTVLMAFGVVLAVCLLATGGDAEVMFSQLGSLSHHYLAASVPARASFITGAAGLLVGLVTLTGLLRLPALAAQLGAELFQGSDHE
jgi:hypothetical protein